MERSDKFFFIGLSLVMLSFLCVSFLIAKKSREIDIRNAIYSQQKLICKETIEPKEKEACLKDLRLSEIKRLKSLQ